MFVKSLQIWRFHMDLLLRGRPRKINYNKLVTLKNKSLELVHLLFLSSDDLSVYKHTRIRLDPPNPVIIIIFHGRNLGYRRKAEHENAAAQFGEQEELAEAS